MLFLQGSSLCDWSSGVNMICSACIRNDSLIPQTIDPSIISRGRGIEEFNTITFNKQLRKERSWLSSQQNLLSFPCTLEQRLAIKRYFRQHCLEYSIIAKQYNIVT